MQQSYSHTVFTHAGPPPPTDTHTPSHTQLAVYAEFRQDWRAAVAEYQAAYAHVRAIITSSSSPSALSLSPSVSGGGAPSPHGLPYVASSPVITPSGGGGVSYPQQPPSPLGPHLQHLQSAHQPSKSVSSIMMDGSQLGQFSAGGMPTGLGGSSGPRVSHSRNASLGGAPMGSGPRTPPLAPQRFMQVGGSHTVFRTFATELRPNPHCMQSTCLCCNPCVPMLGT